MLGLGLSGVRALPLLLARMAAPLAAALLALRAEDGGGRGAWGKLGVSVPDEGLRALLAPAAAVTAGYSLGYLLALAAGECSVCWLLEEARAPLPLLATLALAGGLAAGLTVNMLAALLEEAGWRGYLYPRLTALLGSRVAAAAAAGAVWGLWHGPLVWAGFNYQLGLEGCEGEPASGPEALAAFTTYTVALGLILAWARERWGSVLPAAAGHGTVNAIAGFYAAACVSPRLLGPPAGLMVALGLVVAWLVVEAAAPGLLGGAGEGATRGEGQG